MKRLLYSLFLLLVSLSSFADNITEILRSPDYYVGKGIAPTDAEADQLALADISSQIATYVQSDFESIDEENFHNDQFDSKSKVTMVIRTYTNSSLNDAKKWTETQGSDIVVYRYMKRSELYRIFANRIQCAKDMIRTAEEQLEKNHIDMALKNYYWAMTLIRSVQFPKEVKDDDGRIIINLIPGKITEILRNITVRYDSQDGTDVNLLFFYDGKPISYLDFSYNDGTAWNDDCTAQDGRGMIVMQDGFQDKEQFAIRIEYEYKNRTMGDDELKDVLGIVSRINFADSEKKVVRTGSIKSEPTQTVSASVASSSTNSALDAPLKQTASQKPDDMAPYLSTMNEVISAIATGRYMSVKGFFDANGLDVFDKILNYGTPKIVGTPNLTFFKGNDGTVTARGMQMAFSFTGQKKATFVEDMVFTFSREKKITNVAFGLGKVAENDILCREHATWKPEAIEAVMEFLENYKTAFCLKRFEYIKGMFDENAVIIIGNVAWNPGGAPNQEGREEANQNITYHRYTKEQYMANLQKCFNNPRNKFINVRFSNNDVQPLEKYQDKQIFGIQIAQEYNSATYSDKGYLFLMVDMTDFEHPLIKVRSWQPGMTRTEDLINAGNFY